MKKLLYYLFHRTALVALLLILQVALFGVAIVRFSDYFVYFYFLCVLLSVFVVLHIVNSGEEPGYKIAWIVPILLFPVFGGLLYLLCGGDHLGDKNKMQNMNRRLVKILSPDNKAEALIDFGKDAVNQSRYLEEYAHCPLYTNTWTHYYPLGDDALESMLTELRRATKYIFLEYFIITPGKFWNSILEIDRKSVV